MISISIPFFQTSFPSLLYSGSWQLSVMIGNTIHITEDSSGTDVQLGLGLPNIYMPECRCRKKDFWVGALIRFNVSQTENRNLGQHTILLSSNRPCWQTLNKKSFVCCNGAQSLMCFNIVPRQDFLHRQSFMTLNSNEMNICMYTSLCQFYQFICAASFPEFQLLIIKMMQGKWARKAYAWATPLGYTGTTSSYRL